MKFSKSDFMTSITDMVKEGLKYPFNDGKKVLTLGGIFLLSGIVSLLMDYFIYDSLMVVENSAPLETFQALFAAIPPSNMAFIVLSWIIMFILMLFCSGYLYKVIKYAIEGRSELPDFKGSGKIFLNGIRTLIVGIAYSIPPAILFILGMLLAVNESVGSSVNAIGGFIILIAFVFAIFVAFFEVMAMSNMIAHDSLKAAFEFKGILALIKKIGWLRFIGGLLFAFIVVSILAIFLEIVFGAIASGISILFGSAMVLALANMILQSLLLNPYICLAISRIYGSIYREASSDNPVDDNLELKAVEETEAN